MIVGVLALQGDFREHAVMIERLGATVQQVRQPQHLAAVERLIIPGGESTTIGKLLVRFGLLAPIRERVVQGMPVWGTCAGSILLAREIEDGITDQPNIGVMDITVRRNAYGRQIDSFEASLELPQLDPPTFNGVFIRAPEITRIGADVAILATLPSHDPAPRQHHIVAARQKHMLATTFHPELTNDDRLHRYFLALEGQG